jgi:hypothetical protein
VKRVCREAVRASKTQRRRQNAIVGTTIERTAREVLVPQAIIHAHGQTGSGDVDVHSLHAIGHLRDGDRVELKIRIARR